MGRRHLRLAVRRVLPVEGERRFAEGEAVDVARDGAFERFELAGTARRTTNALLRGYQSLPVRIVPR